MKQLPLSRVSQSKVCKVILRYPVSNVVLRFAKMAKKLVSAWSRAKSQILKEKRTEVEAKRDSQYTLWVSSYKYETTHPQYSFFKSLNPEDL